MGKGLRAAERHHARRVAAGISDDQKAITALGAKLFAEQAEVRALRARVDDLTKFLAECCLERDALRARCTELERLASEKDRTIAWLSKERDAAFTEETD